MGHIVVFNCLAGIPNVALLMPSTVPLLAKHNWPSPIGTDKLTFTSIAHLGFTDRYACSAGIDRFYV